MKVGRLSFDGLVVGVEARRGSPGPRGVFRPSVSDCVGRGGGMFVFLSSPRQQRDAFLDLTEYESIQESDGRASGAEHATRVCTLNCIGCSTSHPAPSPPSSSPLTCTHTEAAHCFILFLFVPNVTFVL